MFIAHLPAGYLISRMRVFARARRAFCLGAVLPDVDMLWFYVVDHGAVHHHSYLTHKPLVWLCVAMMGWMSGRVWIWAMGLGAMLHLTLDSIVGAVTWGWPLSERVFTLVQVPATQEWWVLSFVIHWTFLVEVIVCLLAAWMWQCSRA